MRSYLVAILTVLTILLSAGRAEAGEVKEELRPALTLQKFIRTARKTDDFEDILPFLTEEKREYFRRRQSVFDKDAVREAIEESDKFRDSADFFSRTPYEIGLSRYGTIADRVRKYVSTEIDGDQAVIRVQARVGEEMRPAKVLMVREGDEWKLDDLKVELEI